MACALVEPCIAGETPQALASKLAAAYKNGDLDAVTALSATRDASAFEQAMDIGTLRDCLREYACKVSVTPLTKEFESDMARAHGTREFAVPPEGLIEIKGFVPGKPEAKPEMTVTMPYAKVGGKYEIVYQRYTSQKLAELRTKSPKVLTDDALARGVGRPPDKDWLSKAATLPAGGGEPGEALKALIASHAAAYKTDDYDALVAMGGARARILGAGADAAGKPVPPKMRRLNLRIAFLRDLTDANVLGGYRLGDTAALVVDGHNGAGWIVRGGVLMEKKNGVWSEGEHRTVEIPPT